MKTIKKISLDKDARVLNRILHIFYDEHIDLMTSIKILEVAKLLVFEEIRKD